MKRHFVRGALLAAAMGLSGAGQAALHDRGGGLIYDDVLDITWLQDANYAKTSGYDADGKMNWATANVWTANLIYAGYDDWRLPTMVDTGISGCDFALSGTDCGYNVQTISGGTVYSEMAHMYFNNLGLKSEFSPTGVVQPDFGLFGNGTYNGIDQSSLGQNNVGLILNMHAFVYWSGLGYAPNSDSAWVFQTIPGGQTFGAKNREFYAWAVRDGDVAAVPEPETYALMLAGLGLVGFAAKRRRG